jgi:hypothetical protein
MKVSKFNLIRRIYRVMYLPLFSQLRDVNEIQEKNKTNTNMRRITTFRSTTDRIYDGGPIRL